MLCDVGGFLEDGLKTLEVVYKVLEVFRKILKISKLWEDVGKMFRICLEDLAKCWEDVWRIFAEINKTLFEERASLRSRCYKPRRK